MIATVSIPRDRWSSFFELLYRQTSDRPIRLEVIGRELGDQDMAELLPLVGIDFDTRGSDADSLTITVDDDGEVFTHRIFGPTQIYLARTEANLIQWLAIEEEGGRTIVHFEQFPELEASYPDEQPPG